MLRTPLGMRTTTSEGLGCGGGAWLGAGPGWEAPGSEETTEMPGSGMAEARRLQVEDRGNSLRVGRKEKAMGKEVVAWVPGSRVDACVSLSISLRTPISQHCLECSSFRV